METEKILEMIKKEMGEIPKPLKNIAELNLDVLKNHIVEKKNAYSGDNLDKKTKALIALAVGIALDSQPCIMNNVKSAKKNGATVEEIMETFKVAKFSKAATSISSSAMAFEWLLENNK